MTNLTTDLRNALDPARLLDVWGFERDEWQTEVLRQRPQRALLLCCRQAGKSSTAAAAACHESLYNPGSLSLILAPILRQSGELLRKARSLLTLAGERELRTDSASTLELRNGSRIVSLPGRDETIRGYSAVALLVLDEAAWVPDELYTAVRPMLAISNGRILALSTPNGQRGWFYREWTSTENWHRTKVRADECPRIPRSFLAEERRQLTAAAYASEYDCDFTDAVDSVFFHSDVQAAIDPELAPLYPGGW